MKSPVQKVVLPGSPRASLGQKTSLAQRGLGRPRLANYNFLWVFTGPGRPRPVVGWPGWSGRMKTTMTSK